MRLVHGSLRLALIGLLCWIGTAVAAESQLDVRITPANPALKANIEAYVGSLGERDEAALRRMRRSVQAQAQEAAQALGYYQARIRVRVGGEQPARLSVEVDPGEPVRLRQVSIRIDGPAAELKRFRVPGGDGLKPGAQLNHGTYEDAKRLIQNQASRFGFFSGKFTRQQLRIDPEAGVADIDLLYASGPRYRLGAVGFSGDFPFDETLLQRMVPFQQGAVYDSELIAELNQNLQSSGYFDSVRVDASPLQAQGQTIPVMVHLSARKPRSLGLGLGFSTDVGPRAKASWTRHWVNAEGHSLGTEMELSGPRQNVGAWYEIPLDPPLTDKLRLTTGYQSENLVDTESKQFTLGGEWQSKLASGWQRSLSLNWLHEEYQLGDDAGNSSFLMPGLGYSILSADNKVDPNRGYRLQMEMKGAKRGLMADADVAHVSAMAKGLTSFGGGQRLLGRLQVGGIATDDYSRIPPSLRFFAGGDQSVRGYDYQTLSPKNGDGDRIGGRYMIAGSVEYQYPIAEKWRLATFVDQGNSFNSLDLPSIKTGVGFGIRWVSPVGPLRLDLADGLDNGGGWRIHFSMGPEL
ncbi:autotransporter assembly complex protein TamA [Pseudomonas panipatensis]|uniref:Translocation and assembly module subunit TamA n=1 Tax=Pseudomonas panipatensis TaxID=428992 RepID=A0A1G8ICU7_9PSED|nr:autotransporter assembly complex family protein [Pseudomonas panipatensis]SDI16838.1 translocation and assembly module TamA [Pseudomonas panipatensis]SMP79320.1 autotransporter secretion outer membrane protein TamA [Pseudomonas panipatensis]